MHRLRLDLYGLEGFGLRAVALLALALILGLLSVAQASASPNGVVISEFRFRGPAGGNDEFVELLNSSSGDKGHLRLQPPGLRLFVRQPIQPRNRPGQHRPETRTALPLHQQQRLLGLRRWRSDLRYRHQRPCLQQQQRREDHERFGYCNRRRRLPEQSLAGKARGLRAPTS